METETNVKDDDSEGAKYPSAFTFLSSEIQKLAPLISFESENG